MTPDVEALAAAIHKAIDDWPMPDPFGKRAAADHRHVDRYRQQIDREVLRTDDPMHPDFGRVLSSLEESGALRTHRVLDAVQAAFQRHASTHPTRVPECEVCDLRGSIAGADLLEYLTAPARTTSPEATP